MKSNPKLVYHWLLPLFLLLLGSLLSVFSNRFVPVKFGFQLAGFGLVLISIYGVLKKEFYAPTRIYSPDESPYVYGKAAVVAALFWLAGGIIIIYLFR